MQFYTHRECRAWMHGRELGKDDWPRIEESRAQLVSRKLDGSYADAVRFTEWLANDSEVLLWVTLTKIWSANLHLYYRFRESYGDRRLVEDAPGHLFLSYERAELLSFIQICHLSGWDFWLLGAENYTRVFVSHDEYFEAAGVIDGCGQEG